MGAIAQQPVDIRLIQRPPDACGRRRDGCCIEDLRKVHPAGCGTIAKQVVGNAHPVIDKGLHNRAGAHLDLGQWWTFGVPIKKVGINDTPHPDRADAHVVAPVIEKVHELRGGKQGHRLKGHHLFPITFVICDRNNEEVGEILFLKACV